MAVKNHIIAGDVPKLSVADTAHHDALDQINVINENLTTVAAMIDCVRVLSALERTVRAAREDDSLALGDGFAGGHTLHDDSMPAVLHHAMGLLHGANKAADVLFEAAKGGAK
jgi:hypothetical protein